MQQDRLDSAFQRFRDRGDVGALGEVFDGLAPELVRLARHLAPRAGDAEDLVQAAFVTAIEKAGEYDEERAVAPWLVGILAGHAANLRRKRARRGEQELEFEARADTPSPETRAESREWFGALRSALDALPAGYRDALEPYLHDGRRPREIAALLGITPNAARVRVHRGLEMLRTALPAGFAAGAAVAMAPTRALGDVRDAVMDEAARRAIASSGGASLGWGGVFASQRAILGIAAVLMLVIAAGTWLSTRDMEDVADAGKAPSESALRVAAESLDEPDDEAADVAAASESREAAPAGQVRFVGRAAHYVTGLPIAGARVWTTPADSGARMLRARSDEHGRFEFTAPRGEESTLVVEADGYAPRRAPISAERLARFWMEASRADHDGGARVDLFEIRLLPGAELTGRVVDRDGVGIAGAQLLLAEASGGSLRTFDEHPIGRSGVNGEFELDGRLPCSIAGDGRHWVLFALHPAGAGWTRVAAPMGRERIDDVEIVLDDSLAVEVALLDERGEPLEGALVRLMPMHEPFPSLTGMQSDLLPLAPAMAAAHSAISEADGVARIPAAVAAPEQGPGRRKSSFVVSVELDGVVLHRAFHQALPGSPARIALRLARSPAPIVARGRVVDQQGAPIAGAAIRIRETAGADLAATESSSAGDFELRIEPSAPILLDLVASAPGYVEDARSFDRGTQSQTLPESVEFVLGLETVIAGRVLDDDGRPVEGVQVYADGRDNSVFAQALEETDAQGRFEVRSLVAGEYDLCALFGGEDEFDSCQPVSVQSGSRDAVIVLRRRRQRGGARVELSLADARTGEPLDALNARLLAAGEGRVSAPSHSPGQVVFERIPPGRYVAWVACAGRASAHVELEVRESDLRVRKRVEIGEPASLSGRVDLSKIENPGRAFVRGCIVTSSNSIPGDAAFADGGALSLQVAANAAGVFEAQALAPGRWRVWAEGLGFACEPVEVEVPYGTPTDVALVAQPVPVLELSLANPPGRGWIVVDFACEGGDWITQPTSWIGSSSLVVVNARDGDTRWRLRFLQDLQPGSHAELAPALQGRIEARPGERVRVDLRVDSR